MVCVCVCDALIGCGVMYPLLNVASDVLMNGVDGIAQNCSNASALAMELLQSCAKPVIYDE